MNLKNYLLYIFLFSTGFIYLAPLLLMFLYSLMPLTQIGRFPPDFIPDKFMWINYTSALEFWNFWVGLKNTLIITILCIIGNVLSSSFVAYGFARFEFPGRNILFSLLLGTMMLPFAVTMVPLYLGYNFLGLVNTFVPLILPHYFGVAFFIFLLRVLFLRISLFFVDLLRISLFFVDLLRISLFFIDLLRISLLRVSFLFLIRIVIYTTIQYFKHFYFILYSIII